MYEDLKIIIYPDPRLKRNSVPITQFDDNLAKLTQRMFDMMRLAKGVGLAAPQVGQNIRLFVMNHTGEPQDDRIYVNPVLLDLEGEEEGEEGCLSLPGINVDVVRSKSVRISAQDLAGNKFEQTATGYVPRIWQHEFDHLIGTMITDRMGVAAKLEYRKKLKEMEDQWAIDHPAPEPKKRKR